MSALAVPQEVGVFANTAGGGSVHSVLDYLLGPAAYRTPEERRTVMCNAFQTVTGHVFGAKETIPLVIAGVRRAEFLFVCAPESILGHSDVSARRRTPPAASTGPSVLLVSGARAPLSTGNGEPADETGFFFFFFKVGV